MDALHVTGYDGLHPLPTVSNLTFGLILVGYLYMLRGAAYKSCPGLTLYRYKP